MEFWTLFQQQFAEYAPNIITAILLLVIGLFVAWVIAAVTQGFLRNRSFYGKMEGSPHWSATGNPKQLAALAGSIVFIIILLVFLVPFFEALQLDVITQPLTALLETIFAYLPRLISGVIIFAIAWAIAAVLRVITTTALHAARVDDRLQKATDRRAMPLSQLIGNAVFYFILLLFLPVLLDVLALPGILGPVQDMINQILGALPGVIAAAIILAVAYVVGYIVRELIENLLAGIGFDTLFHRLGIVRNEQAIVMEPSRVVGYLAFAFILLLAAIEAAQVIGFMILAALLAEFLALAARIILGVIVFLLGLALAQFLGRLIRESGMKNARIVAFVAQAAILVLAAAMGLREMGIAEDIVNLAFGLTLGAAAVAAAIAFGIGGKDVAHDVLRDAQDTWGKPRGPKTRE